MAKKSITKTNKFVQSIQWSIEWDDKEDITTEMRGLNMLTVAEDETIRCALQMANGNVSETAKLLGISRATVYEKMKKYKIEVKKNVTVVSKRDNSDLQ